MFNNDHDVNTSRTCDEKVQFTIESRFVSFRKLSIKTRRFSSADARDALSKHLYARLFSWLIGKINETLNNPNPLTNSHQIFEIGLLDIYGFEHFELNSFEQLCINLANEQIQYFFNQVR